MKKIATYIILLATLGSAACSHTDEFGTSRHQGNELVVNAELVSTSDWKTRGGASLEVQSIECGNSVESSDGLFRLSATRQEWTAEPTDSAAFDPNENDAPLTRGTPITSASGIAQMRVNVFNTGTSNWTTSSSRTTTLTATRSGNSYNTSPSYHWPKDPTKKTSFFAYSPVASSSNGLTDSGNNKINYTVPSRVVDQPDLCTAAPKMDIINNTGTRRTQSFALKHQLTAVGFAMLGWNLKITKITVSGVAMTGTLTMNTDGTTSWTTSSTGSREVGVTQNSYTHNHQSSYANITTSYGYLMMIPQTLSDNATVTIDYTSTGTGSASGTTTAKLKDLNVTWGAGDKITYNIRLKTAPAVTSGDMKITTYKLGYTTSSPLTMFTDKDDKVTFKWSESWLKIHMGNPINGNPSQGMGVAHEWTTPGGPISNIYFFATSDNPLTTADRTAIITASGTRSGTKTFTVRQARRPSPYVEINGLLWAKGNLVANGANGCKIGEPGDNGLYFQFGGLIGYKGGASGDGTGITNTRWNNKFWFGAASFSTNDIEVAPINYNKRNFWPSYYDTSSSGVGYYYFNDFSTKYADFQTQNNANDPSEGIGDPCAYYLGSPWRLPKYNELSAIAGRASETSSISWQTAGVTGRWEKTNGPKSAIGAWFGPNSRSGTPTVDTDLFIPTSGSRNIYAGLLNSLGEYGYLWSSSIYAGNHAFALSINESRGVISNYFIGRSSGYPIRCVRNK